MSPTATATPTATAKTTAIVPANPSAARATRNTHQLKSSERLRSGRAANVLGRYECASGHLRELVTRPGSGGSLLVIDHDAATLGDRRMVAHLAADEPSRNVAVVCELYLCDASQRWCRRVTPQDLEIEPFAEDEQLLSARARSIHDAGKLVDRDGYTLALERLGTPMSIPRLAWRRHPPTPEPSQAAPEPSQAAPISVRDAIAALESYEPVRTLTLAALVRHRDDPGVSISALRCELERLDASRLVLNRGLRQAVLAAHELQSVSMSEIAIRCGRVKRDRRGNLSGETSWLARRIGVLPAGGERKPTPWVHSDVLALIARHGLGISPREVELG